MTDYEIGAINKQKQAKAREEMYGKAAFSKPFRILGHLVRGIASYLRDLYDYFRVKKAERDYLNRQSKGVGEDGPTL